MNDLYKRSFFESITGKDIVKEIFDEVYEIKKGYTIFINNEKYKSFVKTLKTYNIETISANYIHPSHYDYILDCFNKMYTTFPAMAERQIARFGTKETNLNNDGEGVQAEFCYAHLRDKRTKKLIDVISTTDIAKNDSEIAILTRDLSLAIGIFNKDVNEIRKFPYNKVCNEDALSDEQVGRHIVVHELGHALIETIASDNIKKKHCYTIQDMNTNAKKRRKYLIALNEEKTDIVKNIYIETCEKFGVHKDNENKLLTEYSAESREECFSEAIGDFYANPFPSAFSICMMETFVELYPEYVNEKEINKRFNEINSIRNKLDTVKRINREKIITELRYEKSTDPNAKRTFRALCVDSRLEGPYEKPVNDAFLYMKTRATAPSIADKSLVEAMPKIIMESNLFEYSSDNVKKAVILALENHLIENKRINKENVYSYGNTFGPALHLIEEKPTGSLAAAVNLYENMHDKGLITHVFAVDPEDTDFNWEYSYAYLENNIHNISKNDILVIAENFNEIVDFPHTKRDEELIAGIKNLLYNEIGIIRGEELY